MDNVIDIRTRKPAERIEIDETLPMSKYFDTWKRTAKDNNIQSVLIITVNKDNAIQWDIRDHDFLHLLQLYIELEAMKRVIYGMLYPDAAEYEIVLEDGEDDE